MKITFTIEYKTVWGEVLYLCGCNDALGKMDESNAIPMRYMGDGMWSYTLELPQEESIVEYHYLVKKYGEVVAREWGACRRLVTNSLNSAFHQYDQWNSDPSDRVFFSSAFTHTLFKRKESAVELPIYKTMVRLKVCGPRIESHQVLGLTGNADVLGNWDLSKVLLLDDSQYPMWRINLDAEKLVYPIKYKFVILDRATHELIAWESDENRCLDIDIPNEGECITVTNMRVHNPMPKWRGAGVAIPLFSLRSEQSWGIGDFADLEKLCSWVVTTRQRVVQILPINDTTITGKWTDSYPYNANSTFALHPIYMNLAQLGTIADAEQRAEFEALRQELNALPAIDYERVGAAKLAYTQLIYKQCGAATLKEEGFLQFVEKNSEWLKPYAAFRYLTNLYGTAQFDQWGKEGNYSPALVRSLCSPYSDHYSEIAFHYFVQYHLHLQLSQVHATAREMGVVLKGDIPIGISRYSVDAWRDGHLFNMNCQAGAPPDDFSVTGQNWGFPTYNWTEMAKDGYSWWRRRFQHMARYFDAYRIDHILGFFRIWEIPSHSVQGLLGYFNPAKPLSVEQINSRGYLFDKVRFTTPYIREALLLQLFGTYVEEVKEHYLDSKGFGRYSLKPTVDTQRKVEALFLGADDERSNTLRLGLYSLNNEVLFIEDPYQKGYYHPRISAQGSYSYTALTPYERNCYDTLYEEYFYHAHNRFWKEQALTKLTPLLAATNMLVCGEDLGMIPQSVPEVMNQKQILSLEIERMPKELGIPFATPAHYPYLSVCTTSTHDLSTLRGWWEEERDVVQRYYNEQLGEEGDAPYFCEPWICERIVNSHLLSPAMLTILPLQDWLAIDGDLRRDNPLEERINVPKDPLNYWRYRMHISLEQLLGEHAFNNKIATLIASAGR